MTRRANFSMTEVVESVLPLGARSQMPGYEYFTGGTCFLARRKRRLFVVTARHALRDKPGEDVWVPHNADTLEPLPLRSLVETAPLNDDAHSAADIAAFEVEERRVSGALAPQINLSAVAFWNPANAKSRTEVVFAGFPKAGLANSVDYEARTISRQRFIGRGRYAESSGQWMHRFDVDELGLVKTLDGMSGSPVFCREGAVGTPFLFAGVLVRGSGNGHIAQFVEAAVTIRLLDRALHRERNEAKRARRAMRGH
jgi:hypothetical protein